MNSKNELVKRYMLEKGINLISKIDPYDFEIWLSNFNRYNICFSRILKKEELLTTEDIVEICSSKDYCVIKKSLLKNSRKYILCYYGIQSTEDRCLDVKGYLIANGYYSDVRPTLLSNFDRSYTVGIVGKNNQHNRKIVDYYRELREELINLGSTDIKELNATDENSIIYLLNHIETGQKILKRPSAPIYQYVSQR